MKTTRVLVAAAAAALMVMGALISGCGDEQTDEVRAMPIDEGVWSYTSAQYDCVTQEPIPDDYEDHEDIVCAADWEHGAESVCPMTRNGDVYTVDCSLTTTLGECQLTARMVGTIDVKSRKHYVVDGTITISATPDGCWSELSGDQEGCVEVHEEYFWASELYDGACVGGKAAIADSELLRDPARLFRKHLRTMLVSSHGVPQLL